jgi:response regulator RpfG family c-di-GMP phosphodiesterase
VPLSDEGTTITSIRKTPTLVIVYAQDREKNTLAICEKLRNSPQSSAAPILLVISRYEIAQGNAVKRMGNAAFIMTPFDEDQLQRKTAELVKDT